MSSRSKAGFDYHPENINSTGMNKGSTWHSSDIRRAFEKIGKAQGMTADEVREELDKIGYNRAKGKKNVSYQYWRDIMAYIHGKPKDSTDVKFSGSVGLRSKSDEQLADEAARLISEAAGDIAGTRPEKERRKS